MFLQDACHYFNLMFLNMSFSCDALSLSKCSLFPVPSEKDSANLSTKIHKTVLVYDLVNFQFSIFMSNYPNVLIISSGLNVIWQL